MIEFLQLPEERRRTFITQTLFFEDFKQHNFRKAAREFL